MEIIPFFLLFAAVHTCIASLMLDFYIRPLLLRDMVAVYVQTMVSALVGLITQSLVTYHTHSHLISITVALFALWLSCELCWFFIFDQKCKNIIWKLRIGLICSLIIAYLGIATINAYSKLIPPNAD